MRIFKTEDGYTFYQLRDGTLVDSVDPSTRDITYTDLVELRDAVDYIEITPTLEDHPIPLTWYVEVNGTYMTITGDEYDGCNLVNHVFTPMSFLDQPDQDILLSRLYECKAESGDVISWDSVYNLRMSIDAKVIQVPNIHALFLSFSGWDDDIFSAVMHDVTPEHLQGMRDLDIHSVVGRACLDLLRHTRHLVDMTKDTSPISWREIYNQMLIFLFA